MKIDAQNKGIAHAHYLSLQTNKRDAKKASSSNNDRAPLRKVILLSSIYLIDASQFLTKTVFLLVRMKGEKLRLKHLLKKIIANLNLEV